MTQGPPTLLALPAAAPDALALALQAVTHHNALAGAADDPALRPVTLDAAEHGQAFTLTGAGGTEHFTLHGTHARGWGGEFHLTESDHRAQLAATVQTLPPLHPGEAPGLLGVPEGLAAHGFTLRAGRWLRWKYAFWMRPLHAVHPDGRVVWLAEYEGVEDRGPDRSVYAGDGRVAALVGNATEEDQSFACAPDDIKAQWVQDGYRPPVFTTHVWRLTPGAADALCAGQAPAADHLVPDGLWTLPGTLDAAADAAVNAALAPYRS